MGIWAVCGPRLSGEFALYQDGWVGWSEARKQLCVPKVVLRFRAPFDKFHFSLRKTFLTLVGGWVGGSGGGAQAAITPPPPLPVTLSRGLAVCTPCGTLPRGSELSRSIGAACCLSSIGASPHCLRTPTDAARAHPHAAQQPVPPHQQHGAALHRSVRSTPPSARQEHLPQSQVCGRCPASLSSCLSMYSV